MKTLFIYKMKFNQKSNVFLSLNFIPEESTYECIDTCICFIVYICHRIQVLWAFHCEQGFGTEA